MPSCYQMKTCRAILQVMGKYMGIDYGARRVGLALSDDGGVFAFPSGVLPNDETLMQTLQERIAAEGVTTVVIGEADNPAGGTNTVQRRVMIFARALEAVVDATVVLASESYSSAEARRATEEQAQTRKTRTVPVDAAAASIILQGYLDKQHNKT